MTGSNRFSHRPAPPTDDAPSPLQIDPNPIAIRSWGVLLLTIFATMFFLYWAKALLLPIVVSVLLAYSLSPVVNTLERIKLPRPLSSAVILLLIITLLCGGGYALKGEAEVMLDNFPKAMRALTVNWRRDNLQADDTLVDKMQEAAVELGRAARVAVGDTVPIPDEALKVKIREPLFSLDKYVWSGTAGVFALIGQTGAVLVLVFLLLASGDFYKRKFVKISGPALSQKKVTVQMIDDFNRHIRRYLFVLLLSGVFVGLGVWLSFLALGVDQAALWGVIASVVCLVPYIGPTVLLAATGLSALVQFASVSTALAVGLTAFAIASVQNSVLTPWLTSRSTRINRVSLFVGLLFLSWLWGLPGLIVATPLLITIKVCCDHIEVLRSVGELLGVDETAHAAKTSAEE